MTERFSTNITNDIYNNLIIREGNVFATSLDIAKRFNKLHKDVLKRIKLLDCSADFNKRNFAPVTYQDAKGEHRPAYNLTRDGCVFLVMRFTGKEAALFQEAYIQAFNRMAEYLKQTAIPENPADQILPVWQYMTDHMSLSRTFTCSTDQIEQRFGLSVGRFLQIVESLSHHGIIQDLGSPFQSQNKLYAIHKTPPLAIPAHLNKTIA